MQIAVLALLLVVAKATANDDDWCAVGSFDHNAANENEDGTTTTCSAISYSLGTRYSAGDLAACDGDYAGYFAYVDRTLRRSSCCCCYLLLLPLLHHHHHYYNTTTTTN